MWTTASIRQHFLSYFRNLNHTVVPSSGLIPKNDPSLLFTNAGMVQFKDIFTGSEKANFPRAVTAQKCIRAGGKHNDLDNVGYTARHHTFFEMLGNFSFGDYFKEQAIDYAWTWVTKELGLPKDRLLVTVYIDDDESVKLWKKIAGLDDRAILRIAGSDNFWSMGDVGPCGPCSEIFYDHGPHIPGGPPGSVDGDGDRFIEIWNLVFMQYEDRLSSDGSKIERHPLPHPSIDTGMGLERVTAVLQGVHNNYDIDVFKNIIAAISDVTTSSLNGPFQASQRVIADHLRSSGFLIAEGITPSNEGRGYVLRRIMRRAMRHAYMMGCEDPRLHRLVPVLVQEMGQAYPELGAAEKFIAETFRLEEERFHRTLGRGLALLEEEMRKLNVNKVFSGDVAFKLYDTYGFPLDLTEDILRSKDIAVDRQRYDQAMAKQRQEARLAWAGSGEKKVDHAWRQVTEPLEPTEFLGYTTTESQGKILGIYSPQLESLPSLDAGQDATLIINQTPFYAEAGGQMGDKGYITSQAGAMFEVEETFKVADAWIGHRGTLLKGSFRVHDTVELSVDAERRRLLKANHSATHLLHAVLRRFLGEHVMQKGSLVAPDRLRFDFSYPTALTPEQVGEIELEVNRLIRSNTRAQTHVMSLEEAQKSGAVALFGEKYGDQVRVVMMGEKCSDFPPYSIEFCGGTHVTATGDIGYFKIMSESGVASGVRRIEALTGQEAERYVVQKMQLLDEAVSSFKTVPDRLLERIDALKEEKKNLERALKDAKAKSALGQHNEEWVQMVGGIQLVFQVVDDLEPGDLKGMVDQVKKTIKSGVVIVGSRLENKASVVVGVTADLTDRINAVPLVQEAARVLGGKGGGGRPDMAQAGGTAPDQFPAVFAAIRKMLE